jgi:predicted Zn-dependent protease
MRFLERKEPAAALDRFEALTAREPQLARAHLGALLAVYELGPARYGQGLAHGLAVQAAERELSQEQRSLALRAFGVMLLTQDQPKAAAAALAELVVREPTLAEGQYNYACALARVGDAGGALFYLGQALRIDRQLVEHARADPDLASLRDDPSFLPAFQRLLGPAATSRP